MKAMEAIKQRISVRSYTDQPLPDQVRSKLEEGCRELKSGPFGAAVRLNLLDLEPLNPAEQRSLGTYGVIRGARHYILGAVKKGKGSLEDIGYCMEKIVLEATSLGLGTCWLGGTFRRSAFGARIDLTEDEMLPAVSPVGYTAKEISSADRIFRFGARSRKRKPWNELFFSIDRNSPLTEAEAGDYRQILEAVRMGPSASNRQPWRIIRDESGTYHLYMKENEIYNNLLGKIHLQNVDIGIAMCHFEIAAHESGLTGSWKVNGPAYEVPGLRHMATWR